MPGVAQELPCVRLHACALGHVCSQDEETYQASPELQSWTRSVDLAGLSLVTLQTSVLYVLLKDNPETSTLMRALVVTLTLVSALHVAAVRQRLSFVVRHRQLLAVLHRIGRLCVLLLPIRRHRGDLAHTQLLHHTKHTPAWVLAGYALFLPLLQLQATLIFALPMAVTLWVQPVALLLVACLTINTPATLAAVPGLRQAAEAACRGVNGALELLLYCALDHAAFGLPDNCSGSAAFAQLLAFSNFTLTWCVPLYATHAIELRHKRAFWKARGRRVELSSSLPAPLASLACVGGLPGHMLALAAAAPLLWLLSELLAGSLLARPAAVWAPGA